MFEEKKNKNIENMFVKTSKDDFWKSIRSYKEGENKHPLRTNQWIKKIVYNE